MPFGVKFSPVRIAIVTARNGKAEIRPIKSLRHWDVYADVMFFLGGAEKAKVLKAFRTHIFFDDQDTHLELAAKHVPSAKVPHRTTTDQRGASGSSRRASSRRSRFRHRHKSAATRKTVAHAAKPSAEP